MCHPGIPILGCTGPVMGCGVHSPTAQVGPAAWAVAPPLYPSDPPGDIPFPTDTWTKPARDVKGWEDWFSMQEQLEEKLGAIVAGRYMTLLWANAGKPRPEDAELRESIRRLVTDFHSRPLTIGLALRLFSIDPLTRPLTVHVVGASHVETLNTRLTDYDELTRMFPGHQGVEMVMVGVDVVDGPIMRPPLTTLAPRGKVYLSSYKGLYHDFWESHVETKLAAPPDLVVGFHPGECLCHGGVRPSHPTAGIGTSTGHMGSGTMLSTLAAPVAGPEGGLGHIQGFAPRHNGQLGSPPGTWLPYLPARHSVPCLCHPPAGETDPSLQVSVLWLSPGHRVWGAPRADGKPDPTLLRFGVSSTEWVQLEPAFLEARVGWERGGILMAVSPQVSMPAQTCWRAGCPPCCCCGIIACPCSSPCTGEHSPTHSPSEPAQTPTHRACPLFWQ